MSKDDILTIATAMIAIQMGDTSVEGVKKASKIAEELYPQLVEEVNKYKTR